MEEGILTPDLEDLGGIEGLKKLSPGPKLLRRLENVYTILSCSNRILIIYYLNFSPLTAGQLSEVTGMAPNLLSFHLGKLKEAGVVHGLRDGKYIIYSITEMGRSITGSLTG